MRQMTRLVVRMLAAALLLAACGSSSDGTSSNGSAAGAPGASSGDSMSLVKTARNASLGGTILVDSRGLTLYHLTGEQNGKWICTSTACVGTWRPLTAKSGAKFAGGVGSLGTVRRPDGTVQLTFKGMPLYTFVKDVKPGQATGEGIKDVGIWTAVTVGSPVSRAPAASTSAP